MVPANKGDFVILETVEGKRELVKVLATGNKKFRFRFADGKDDSNYDAAMSELVANLGNAPRNGSAYGVKIEPLRRTVDHDFWGQINLFVDYDDKEVKHLTKCLDRVQNILDKHNLPEPNVEIDIRQQSGKYDGMYKVRPKAETDLMTLRPRPEFDSFEYVALHEYAHGIWAHNFTPKMRLSWMKTYAESVVLSRISDKELVALRNDLVSSGDLGQFIKDSEEETRRILKSILKHIKSIHGFERHHIELMLAMGEDIAQLWPSSVDLSDKTELISSYATKSPEELFAESFSMHYAGLKIPKSLASLLDQCVRRLKTKEGKND